MTREEFDSVMAILNDEYDPVIQKFGSRRLNVYGPGRATAIFKMFESLTIDRFSQLVMRAFETERQAPMAKDLSRIFEDMRIEAHEQRKNSNRRAVMESYELSEAEKERARVVREQLFASVKRGQFPPVEIAPSPKRDVQALAAGMNKDIPYDPSEREGA